MSYLSLGDRSEEDGDFFGMPGAGGPSGSRLGSLFGMSAQMDNSASSNQSLTYTAPKAPKQGKQQPDQVENKTPQSQASVSGVACAVAVTAYRYLNNQYKKQGKLGAALLSNFADKDYKILMYVSKQQPVTTAKISPDFQFNIQPNNYASFYDDQRQMWSIMFGNSEQLIEFAKQVCLAKFSCDNGSRVISQDLLLGEEAGQALESGDSVEAKYTGWLVQNGTFGTVFDTNHKTEKTFRFKTGKGKVIKGWDQGMPGMKKGGKRFLIIPPSFAYGSKGAGSRVPPNSSLAFEVDVLRIKHTKDTTVQNSSSVESVPQAVSQPELSFGSTIEAPFTGIPTAVEAITSDETVKGRTASFNEQLAHMNTPPDSSKAKIMSRMAKVGQAMLPQQPPIIAETQPVGPTQSSSHPVAASPGVRMTHTPPQPIMQMMGDVSQMRATQSPAYSNGSGHSGMEQVYMHNPHIASYQQAVHPQGMIPQAGVQHVGQFIPPSSISPYTGSISGYQTPFNQLQPFPVQTAGPELLPTILTESRQHSSELKLLLEKMDKVSEKVEELKKSSTDSRNGLDLSAGQTIDGALLSHNIQRIIQENERMKKQVLEKNKLIEAQNDKVADLLQQNQKYVEESHLLMEKRNVTFKETFGQSQERTLLLEQEKIELSNKLSDATSKICELQLSLADTTDHANSLEKRVRETASDDTSKRSKDQARNHEMEQQLLITQQQLEEERSKRSRLEVEVKTKAKGVNDATEKNLLDLKQLMEEEKRKMLQDTDELKMRHQEEIRILTTKQEKDSQQLREEIQELEEKWKTKCKEAVATISKAAEEKIEELNQEKEENMSKLEIIQKKFIQLRTMYEEKVKNEEELLEQVEELDITQQKYENLRNQATMMKGKYEARIGELEEESERIKETEHENESERSGGDITDQVKTIMNTVFQQVRAKISSDEEYTGSQVLSIILNIIKATTLKLLKPEQGREEQSEEEESEEEEGEDNKETEDELENEQSDNEEGKDVKETEDEGEHEQSDNVEEAKLANNLEKSGEEENTKNLLTDENIITEENEAANQEQINGEPDGDVINQEDLKIENPSDEEEPPPVKKEDDPDEVEQEEDDSDEVEQDEDHDLTQEEAKDVDVNEEGVVGNQEEETGNIPESMKDSENQENGTKESEDNMGAKTEKTSEKIETETMSYEDKNDRSISPASDTKPQPPPLFDDDESDEDLDWLK